MSDAVSADTAYVGLGSNIGDRRAALRTMREWFATSGLEVAASPVLWTRAVGVTRQPDFLNQVVRLRSPQPLPGQAWLERCRAAQDAAGRRFTYRWGPRRADADLLLLGRDGAVRVDTPSLRVPHPEIASRPFVCAQLDLVEPGLRHPDGWRFADRAGRFAGISPQ